MNDWITHNKCLQKVTLLQYLRCSALYTMPAERLVYPYAYVETCCFQLFMQQRKTPKACLGYFVGKWILTPCFMDIGIFLI